MLMFRRGHKIFQQVNWTSQIGLLTVRYDSSWSKTNESSKFKRQFVIGAFGSMIAFMLGYKFHKRNELIYCAEKNDSKTVHNKPGDLKNNLPFYSHDEISKHTSVNTKVWVTYRQGVYDITEFIEQHPGGNQVLLAAGDSVEPFWALYGVHENPHVYEILETYRIGNLKTELHQVTEKTPDVYFAEPVRHNILKIVNKKPFNAETPSALLVEHFHTPNELFYVRNHLPVPEIDPKTYELEVEIENDNKVVSFTLDELKKMPSKTISATIMCAGNRRSEMMKVKSVKGLEWGIAAVGNAKWTGVPLRYILEKAGYYESLENSYNHIQFEAVDMDVTGTNYGASIPIWKGMDKRGDVILAYEMNGVPLPRDHGYPIRVIIPGVVGARNVKWLSKIIVSKNESSSHWQRNDYKGFSPSVDWDSVDYSKSPAIQELPVISAICIPTNGDYVEVTEGKINLKGYAWSGGGQKIIRVDVSSDKGKTWHVAHFDHQDDSLPPQHWAWTLWSIALPVDSRQTELEIWAKAVDSSYNTQPESFEHIWNLRGVLNNAYHKITVNVKK